MHTSIYHTFSKIDNTKWIETLLKTPNTPVINGVTFPGFPDTNTQVNMIGSSGANALYEVSLLYQEIHNYINKCGMAFTPETRVLDFGCGFGRIIRFFMKDVAPGNLIGTDVYPEFVHTCNNTFQGVQFDQNEPLPPLAYPDASFDIIYAYSVFSHLSESAHLDWLKEFQRILKPNGMVFITLRQKEFLVNHQRLRGMEGISPYNKALTDFFGDSNTMLPQYDAGEYIYLARGGGGVLTNDFYGDTVIPPRYIEKAWPEYFKVMDLFDDPSRLAQALIVLTNKESKISMRHDTSPAQQTEVTPAVKVNVFNNNSCLKERYNKIKFFVKTRYPKLTVFLKRLRSLV